MNNLNQQQFPGFPKEPATNYWPYPRVMNGFWYTLTGSEQKVLDYLLRHTWGYKKTGDFISYSQFLHGIRRKKTGEWVDKGCGLRSQTTLGKALRELEEKGFIQRLNFGGRTSLYTLKFISDASESGEPLQIMERSTPKNGEVTTPKNGDTIKDSTIKDLPIKEMPASLRSADSPSSLKAQPPSEASPDAKEGVKKEKIDASVKEVLQFYRECFKNFYDSEPPTTSKADIKMVELRLSEGRSVEELKCEISWFLDSKLSEELGSTLKTCFCGHVFSLWLTTARGGYSF